MAVEKKTYQIVGYHELNVLHTMSNQTNRNVWSEWGAGASSNRLSEAQI